MIAPGAFATVAECQAGWECSIGGDSASWQSGRVNVYPLLRILARSKAIVRSPVLWWQHARHSRRARKISGRNVNKDRPDYPGNFGNTFLSERGGQSPVCDSM